MCFCWRTPSEYVQSAACSRAMIFRFQNPAQQLRAARAGAEDAGNQFFDEPAARHGGCSPTPCGHEYATPRRSRHESRGSGDTRACACSRRPACHSQDLANEAVHVHDELILTRTGAGHPRTTQCLKKVPNVDSAATVCPSTTRVWLDRNTSQSSMQSAPSAIADTSGIALRPGFAAPAQSPRSTVCSTRPSIPSRSASTAGSTTPAGDHPLIVEHDPRCVRQTVHHSVIPWRRTRSRWHGPSCLHQVSFKSQPLDDSRPQNGGSRLKR